jgi:hypothetical protein
LTFEDVTPCPPLFFPGATTRAMRAIPLPYSSYPSNSTFISGCPHLFDSAYLELAMRKDAAIATLDKQLVKAAELSGVKLFR